MFPLRIFSKNSFSKSGLANLGISLNLENYGDRGNIHKDRLKYGKDDLRIVLIL